MPRSQGLQLESGRVSVWASLFARRLPSHVEYATLVLGVAGIAAIVLAAGGYLPPMSAAAGLVGLGIAVSHGWWTARQLAFTGELVADEHGVVIGRHRFEYTRLRVALVQSEAAVTLLTVAHPDRRLDFSVHRPTDLASLHAWVARVNRRALTAEAAEIDVEGLDRVRAMLQRDGPAEPNSNS